MKGLLPCLPSVMSRSILTASLARYVTLKLRCRCPCAWACECLCGSQSPTGVSDTFWMTKHRDEQASLLFRRFGYDEGLAAVFAFDDELKHIDCPPCSLWDAETALLLPVRLGF